MALRRINKEYCDLLAKPEEGISAGPRLGDRLFPHWDGYIHGPVGTPYEGGIFKLDITFPESYPFKPPRVKFATKVLHCNIDSKGQVNLDILRDCWSPALTIQKVLMSIRCLLEDPNPDDPLVPDLARILKSDPKKYRQLVREAVLQHATPRQTDNSDDDDD